MADSIGKPISKLKREARSCRACPLWAPATQTVFGEGKANAKVMLIGEQPGNDEDLQGKPFVGPAGRLLDKALHEAGIDRQQLYVTNAVKHFKYQLRGKRRMHKTPAQSEIAACAQWLEGELAALHPKVVVCLGATAARALFGSEFRVSTMRGRFVPSAHAQFAYATLHPSALLRLRGDAEREQAFKQFVKDLQLIQKALAA